MELRNLGRSGLLVSAVGLGCNNFGWRIEVEPSRKVVHKALDVGITLLDTADVYGGNGESEDMLGQILGARRKDVVLATKFASGLGPLQGQRFGSRAYVMGAVEASLKRLRTDWIDLYQLHWPDPRTPMEETLRALDDLVHQGKVRYIGISNHTAWQIADAAWIAKHHNLNAFVSSQDEYSLLVRGVEKEMIPAMREFGLGLLPYFPLAAGLLTGKYKKGEKPGADTRFASANMGRLGQKYMTDANWPIVEGLEKLVAARGHTMLELAFSWLLANPTVSSVIAGATTPEQIEANAKAASWKIGAEDLAEIDKITAQA